MTAKFVSVTTEVDLVATETGFLVTETVSVTTAAQWSAAAGRRLVKGTTAAHCPGPRSMNMEPRYDDPSGSFTYDEGWHYDSGPAAPRERKRPMVKPKLDTYKPSDVSLLVAGTTVKDAMTANAAEFPASAADVTALGGELTDFQVALQAAENGKLAQQALVDVKDAARELVAARLRTLISQVHLVAKGDINLIHDAGMQGSDEPTPVVLGQVQNLRLTPSEQEGELFAQWERVPGARMYRVQISTDTTTPPVDWSDKLNSTRTKCALNHNLVSATKVWVRVCASGCHGDGPWSDIARKTVP